jgi:RNA polymerase sigma factor (TIGR02999 family)
MSELPTAPVEVAEPIGDDQVSEGLSPLLYAELKALAAKAIRGERSSHTLQTTALVHEAWLRVADQRQLDPDNRGQFLGLAAQMMRRVLVDHARRRAAAKRPTSDERLSIDEIDLPASGPQGSGFDSGADLIQLDSALVRLHQINSRQAKVIDLKFFAGLELEEIADVLGVARPTVVRDWRMARAWLQRELSHI